MISVLIDTAGLASITEGVNVLAGRGWAFVAAGIALLILSAVAEGEVRPAMAKMGRGAQRGLFVVRARLRRSRDTVPPHSQTSA